MIKIINERSLHEVIREMRARGVTLKDTEGFGINMDQSGHTYVVYMGEEEETGVIDTSAGEAGVSAYINPGSNANDYRSGVNPNYSYSAVKIGIVAPEDTDTLANSSGNTWTVTLSNAAGVYYIKPNTFSIAAVDSAPIIKDDGLGILYTDDANKRRVGTINYDTGAVSVTYYQGMAPNPASTVTATYKYSAIPGSSVFPKLVSMSHLVFVLSEQASVTFTFYDNDPDRAGANAVPSLFGVTETSREYLGGEHLVDFSLDGKISLNLNTLVSDRKVRWIKMDASSGYIKAVYAYWTRLST